MKESFLFTVAALSVILSFGQSHHSIEISFIGRYDRHSNHISNYAGRAYNDTTKTFGLSYGGMIIYKRKITDGFNASLGIGYYRLCIDKIKGNMPFNSPGTRTARNINYNDGSTNLLYGTTRYYYNNLALYFAIDRELQVSKDWKLDFGAEALIYSSISQRYKLTYDAEPRYYSTSNSKSPEFGVNLTAGVIINFKNKYIIPSLIIPVFQQLKGDIVFYEPPGMKINKWFYGIGISLKAGLYI